MARTRVGIVGAGPAGIMAALEAARAGAEVHLFDTNALIGRKLLVTGNSRCNITNLRATADRYTCSEPTALATVLKAWGPERVLTRLEEYGILTYATDDGWCYPLSESAATVVDALAAALEAAGVALHLQTHIAGIALAPDGVALAVGGPADVRLYDRAIVASGGKAYPALGSRGDVYPLLERLGHTVAPVLPALVPIVADVRHLRALQGVRLDVGLRLEIDGVLAGESLGNLLFAESGFSGPAAMDVSHLASAHPESDARLRLDLLPRHRERLWALLRRMRWEPVPLRVLLGAALPPKVPPAVLASSGLAADARMPDLAWEEIERVMAALGDVTACVTGTRGFAQAQVSSGGVPLGEVDPATMASLRVPGLHLAGEVLDAIGPCGGYNLQLAWATGAIAGEAAGSPAGR